MNITEEEFYPNGKLQKRHVNNGDLCIVETYYDNKTNSIEEQSFFNGDIISESKEYYKSGNIKNIMKYSEYGESPSDIGYYKSGNIKSHIWRNTNRKMHRDNEPAEIYYYENGNVKLNVWYRNGKKHRIDDVAEECFNNDGKSVYKAYYINGKLHGSNYYAEWCYDRYESYDENYEEKENEAVESSFSWYSDGEIYKEEVYEYDKMISKMIKDGDDFITTEYEEDGSISSILRENGDDAFLEKYHDGKLYRSETIHGNDVCEEEYNTNGDIIGRQWLCNNIIHRDDLHAVEIYNDSGILIEKHWYKNGVKHRDNGLAVEYINGGGEIWIDGVRRINFDNYIGDESCSICYELKDNMILTKCKHIFCKTCIEKWMLENNDCSYCRQKL